jgi:hypothetical protein
MTVGDGRKVTVTSYGELDWYNTVGDSVDSLSPGDKVGLLGLVGLGDRVGPRDVIG